MAELVEHNGWYAEIDEHEANGYKHVLVELKKPHEFASKHHGALGVLQYQIGMSLKDKMFFLFDRDVFLE